MPNIVALLLLAAPIALVGTLWVVVSFDLFWPLGILIFGLIFSVVIPLIAVGMHATRKSGKKVEPAAKAVAKVRNGTEP